MKRQRSDDHSGSHRGRKRAAFSQHAGTSTAIDVIAHASSRLPALLNLQALLDSSVKSTATTAPTTAFAPQSASALRLPHHLRRRTTSHARRGRGHAVARAAAPTSRAVDGSCDDDDMVMAKGMALSRAFRRKPSFLRLSWRVARAAAIDDCVRSHSRGGGGETRAESQRAREVHADGRAPGSGERHPPLDGAPGEPYPPMFRLHTHGWHAKRFSMERQGQGKKEGRNGVWELSTLVPILRRDAGTRAALSWTRDWGTSVRLGACDALSGTGTAAKKGEAKQEECAVYDSTLHYLPIHLKGRASDVVSALQCVLDDAAHCGVAALSLGNSQGVTRTASRSSQGGKRRAKARREWRGEVAAEAEGQGERTRAHVACGEVRCMLYAPGAYPGGAIAPVAITWGWEDGHEADGEQTCIVQVPAPTFASCASALSTAASTGAVGCSVGQATGVARFSLRGHPRAVLSALHAALFSTRAPCTRSGEGSVGASAPPIDWTVHLSRGRAVGTHTSIPQAKEATPASDTALAELSRMQPAHAIVRAFWGGLALGPEDADPCAASPSLGGGGGALSLPDFLPLTPSPHAHHGMGGAGVERERKEVQRVRVPVLLMPVPYAAEGEHIPPPSSPCRHADLPAPGAVDLLLPSWACTHVWHALVSRGRARAIGREGWEAVHTGRGFPTFPAGHPDTHIGAPGAPALVVHGAEHVRDFFCPPAGHGTASDSEADESDGSALPAPCPLLRVHVRCIGRGGAIAAGGALFAPSPQEEADWRSHTVSGRAAAQGGAGEEGTDLHKWWRGVLPHADEGAGTPERAQIGHVAACVMSDRGGLAPRGRGFGFIGAEVASSLPLLSKSDQDSARMALVSTCKGGQGVLRPVLLTPG